MQMHVVSLVLNKPSDFKRKDALGRWVAYAKTPEVITLTPAGFASEFGLETAAEFLHVGLSTRLIDQALEESSKRLPSLASQRIGIRDHAMIRIVDLLRRELDEGSISGRLYVDSLASALAARYLVAEEWTPTTDSRVRPLPSRLVQRIRDKMEANIAEDLSLEELSKECGYSGTHFLRMFRAATGITPHDFLISLRLQRAQALLVQNQRSSIVEVAGACGFPNQSYFANVFRRRFGLTPSAFRRQYRLR